MVDLTQCPSESLVSNTSEAVSYTKNTNLADSRGPQELPAESGLVSFTSTADKMRNLLKSKAEEWSAVMKRKKTLQLLDLPLDILKDIVKEVTHTNDLISLALTHSAFHNLAVPHIYSRFDIVWPEGTNSGENRSGVDALTYGLSTLVMAEEVFGESNIRGPGCSECAHCGKANVKRTGNGMPKKLLRQNRRGNWFAKFTRKFSIGNGPPELVQEYLISEESGKMLGTLVALAVARMLNLETFVWDMPTGIRRDIWIALSSLGDRCFDSEPKLEKVWIRWHDNKSTRIPIRAHEQINVSSSGPPPSIPVPVPPANLVVSQPGPTIPRRAPTILEKSYKNIEHPNLSILPALKSITILDIDEPAYLEELSIVIERSMYRLRELRIGAASSTLAKSWSANHDSLDIQNTTDQSIRCLTSGGMLGMVMSKIFDCSRLRSSLTDTSQEDQMLPQKVELEVPDTMDTLKSPKLATSPVTMQKESHAPQPNEIEWPNPVAIGNIPLVTMTLRPSDTTPGAHRKSSSPIKNGQPGNSQASPATAGTSSDQLGSNATKLRLETLELEKVPITVPVLQKAIDWSILTSLTILNCEDDEMLWKALRKTYMPPPRSKFSTRSMLNHSRESQIRKLPLSNVPATSRTEYRLRLKRIHTNNVSPALVSFLKDALAPDSLEWMFLQDSRRLSASKVPIDSIYKGPLRRHRASLKKVMIDSTNKKVKLSGTQQRWTQWTMNREIITFITSGKMSSLRELAFMIAYKDWHFFLQRLPNIPHLRSLYIPHISYYAYDSHHVAQELALGVVDIVALRPEIELCYMGIGTQCYEILENKDSNEFVTAHGVLTLGNMGHGMDDSDEDSDAEDDDDEDEEDEESTAAPTPGTDLEDGGLDGTESDASSEDDIGGTRDGKRLWLREILFYDDKVSIFKARHAQL